MPTSDMSVWKMIATVLGSMVTGVMAASARLSVFNKDILHIRSDISEIKAGAKQGRTDLEAINLRHEKAALEMEHLKAEIQIDNRNTYLAKEDHEKICHIACLEMKQHVTNTVQDAIKESEGRILTAIRRNGDKNNGT